MTPAFADLGTWVARRPWRVVALWLLAIVAGAWMARQLPAAVIGGSGGLAGSPSERVATILRNEFSEPLIEPLIVALSSTRYGIDDPAYRMWIATATELLRSLPEVSAVIDYTADGLRPRSAEGHVALLLVALRAADTSGRERAVPRVRAALVELKTRIRGIDPSARVVVTGQAAMTVDINEINRHDGDLAERRALPLTLAILLLCFGALAAACLPVAMGLATTTMALGLAWCLAFVLPVSNLLENVVSMLGLALGIDYSLLMVSRFRLASAGRRPEIAVAIVMGECGPTIVASGLAVIVGLLGLLFSPLLETRSVGIGGALVVVVSIVAALTLLPALLALLGSNVDWPASLARPLARCRGANLWPAVAAAVVHRPWAALLGSTALTVAIALPGLLARSGFDNDSAAFPVDMESRIGADLLTEIGEPNLLLPIYVVLRASNGRQLLDPDLSPQLDDFVGRLAADPRIARVGAPTPDHSMSHDGTAGLFQIIAARQLDLAGVQALAHHLVATDPGRGLEVEAGGPAVYYNDYALLMAESFTRALCFVIAATLIVLFVVFRSWLLPVKAVLTNLLAVAAGFGAVVAVFQLGWFASWIGLVHTQHAIPLVVPLLCFCLCFGLSMDYEVFLLRRIQADYARCGDNRAATAAGLASTGPVITGAAAVMVAVFGAFVATDLVLLKMIGFGLAVTVLIDATLIRCLLVPAAMCLAGRWNWAPGAMGARA